MNPLYFQARFLTSTPNLKGLPDDQGKEIAFAGRSNAGKSSAINALTRQNNLARTSKTPGRTQMLNFFAINDRQRLVDLPGYGYAQVAPEIKQQWHRLMESYLHHRSSLCAIVLVMDIRHPLMPFDWQMIEWCQYKQLALHILLTKSDKLTTKIASMIKDEVQQALEHQFMPITIQLFSAPKKAGIDEIHHALDGLFNYNSA